MLNKITNIKLIHCNNPEYPKESYTIGFGYKGKKYSLSLPEPITNERIIEFLQRVVWLMEGLK